MEKQNVFYPYNGILFDNEKEWDTNTCYDMDETWRHWAKWKKSKDDILLFHLHEIGKSIETKSILVAARGWGNGGKGVIANEYRISFRMKKKCS